MLRSMIPGRLIFPGRRRQSDTMNRVSRLELEPPRPAPELSIIVPTFNERENLPVLIDTLRQTLPATHWEIIIVDDDSPDGTAELAREIGAKDPRVRCIRRVARRGLSGACLEGILASQAPFVAVMDADMQHDEQLLMPMLALVRSGQADIVVGTRYAQDGLAEAMSPQRFWVSRVATKAVQTAFGLKLSDPMSGFFMLDRRVVEKLVRSLSTQGFKLLLDIVMTGGRTLRIAELPYQFRSRRRGESKLDVRVTLDFAGLVLSKATNDVLSARFVIFAFFGLVGTGIHVAVLAAALQLLELGFAWAQALATVVAIAANFILHNAFTYRDQRLRGWSFVTGLMRFYVAAMLGAVANVGVANWIFSYDHTWWVAGLLGAILGLIWNYVIASIYVWRIR
jgi:dolichol-phosphate mannosyltransferase